jgi:methionyl aminopeptidase
VARHHAGQPGIRLGDIGWAIQKFAEANGFSVVREFCGHGIGRNFHEEPQVLHYGKPGHAGGTEPGMDLHHRAHDQRGPARREGIRQRRLDHRHQGPFAVGQWEHTVLVTETGYEVLTLSEGSPPPPAFVKG